MWIINEMRRMMLAQMELYWDELCVLDSMPIPVVSFIWRRSPAAIGPLIGRIMGKSPPRR